MLYIVSLIIYIIIFFYVKKDRLVSYLLLFQILSVFSGILLNYKDNNDIWLSSLNMSFIIITNLIIIFAWKGLEKKVIIIPKNKKRLNMVSDALCILSVFIMIILLITTIILLSYTTDINQFKYEGTNHEDFYYTMLPFGAKPLILCDYLYVISFFLMPLHFVYLVIGDKKRALWNVFFSINIILYGMTFFSRWTILLFLTLYVSHMLIFRNIIPRQRYLRQLKIVVWSGSILISVFIVYSIARFEDSGYRESYMSSDSWIKNETLYSTFDYLAQHNKNELYLLGKYEGDTFQGDYAFSMVRNVLAGLKIAPPSNLNQKKEKLWAELPGAFKGFTTYSVYDWGYVITFLVCIAYFYIIRQGRKTITIKRLLFISLFLQIPLCSIFYSQMPIIILCLIPYCIISRFL